MRRYPRIKRTGCPPSVLSCTAWGFSCCANYSAHGELLPRLFTLACAKKRTVVLSKNRRCLFCDTFRQRPLSRTLPAYSTRYAAVWCSDFPPANPAERDSPAIICHRSYSSTSRSRCICRIIRAMIRRFQPGQDGSRPPTVGGAMATSSYCRRGKSTLNHASPGQSSGCRLSGTFDPVCLPAR